LSLRNLPIFSRNAQLTYLPQILKDRHAQGVLTDSTWDERGRRPSPARGEFLVVTTKDVGSWSAKG
jgi:hypothetical protein